MVNPHVFQFKGLYQYMSLTAPPLSMDNSKIAVIFVQFSFGLSTITLMTVIVDTRGMADDGIPIFSVDATHFLTSRFVHPYHLDESISSFRGLWWMFILPLCFA